MQNAKDIKQALTNVGLKAYGGVNAPYVWLKTPRNMSSWEFFDYSLNKLQIIGTPGVGFGLCGEGFFRFTAFASKEQTKKALQRITENNFNL